MKFTTTFIVTVGVAFLLNGLSITILQIKLNKLENSLQSQKEFQNQLDKSRSLLEKEIIDTLNLHYKIVNFLVNNKNETIYPQR